MGSGLGTWTNCQVWYQHRCLLRNGKANTLVTEVKLSVISTHENITKNPERTIRSRDIHSNESRKTDRLTSSGHVQDVLGRSQDELSSSNDDVQIRERGNLRAIYGGFSVGGRNQRANLRKLEIRLKLVCLPPPKW